MRTITITISLLIFFSWGMLAAVRRSFCGRAIHNSLESWLRDIEEAVVRAAATVQ
jgi:hypothetical protein